MAQFTQIFALLFPILLFFQNDGKPKQEFKVVYVKGKPLKSGKIELRDGQKMAEPDKVVFTTMLDLVILLNADFEKIRLKPKSTSDLNRQHSIDQYKSKKEFFRVRGSEGELEFQSLSDTLILDLAKDLKKSRETQEKQYLLLDFFGESHPKSLRIEDDKLVIIPPKKGMFFLHFRQGLGRSETLATLEFLDRDEVSAELKYVKNLESHPDSVSNKQIFYLKKTYPKVPENQYLALLGM